MASRGGGERPIIDAEYEEVAPPPPPPKARAKKAAPPPASQRVDARPTAEPARPAESAFTPDVPREVNLTATVRPSGFLGSLVEAFPISLRVPLPNVAPSARAGLLFAAGVLGGIAASTLRRPPPPPKLPRDEDDDAE